MGGLSKSPHASLPVPMRHLGVLAMWGRHIPHYLSHGDPFRHTTNVRPAFSGCCRPTGSWGTEAVARGGGILTPRPGVVLGHTASKTRNVVGSLQTALLGHLTRVALLCPPWKRFSGAGVGGWGEACIKKAAVGTTQTFGLTQLGTSSVLSYLWCPTIAYAGALKTHSAPAQNGFMRAALILDAEYPSDSCGVGII